MNITSILPQRRTTKTCMVLVCEGNPSLAVWVFAGTQGFHNIISSRESPSLGTEDLIPGIWKYKARQSKRHLK